MKVADFRKTKIVCSGGGSYLVKQKSRVLALISLQKMDAWIEHSFAARADICLPNDTAKHNLTKIIKYKHQLYFHNSWSEWYWVSSELVNCLISYLILLKNIVSEYVSKLNITLERFILSVQYLFTWHSCKSFSCHC